MQLAIDKTPQWLVVAQKGIQARAAQTLADVVLDGQKLPVWTVRPLGRGKVHWLNVDLDGHRAVHTGGAAGEISVAVGGSDAIRAAHWALFEHVVRQAGIAPRCRLTDHGQPLFDAETWYYQTPSGRSWLVAHHLSGKVDQPVTVSLAMPGHVYDLRTHKHVGSGGTFQAEFPQGRLQVYAVLGYKVAGVSLTVDKPQCRPGDIIRAACTMQTDGPAADLHALRLRLLDPAGAELPAHRTVVLARDGKADVQLPLALNQPSGQYKLCVLDITSGMTAEARFEVTPRK